MRGRSIVNSYSESSYEIGISLQLEAIGIEAQNDPARIALRRAGEIENEHYRNVARLAIDLSVAQCSMAELEWYKERCEKEDGIPYYDCFKKHGKKEIDTNLRTEKLAEFWDGVIEMWERDELPSDFQSQNKWINAGNTYRKLVEPLDIAYHYRTGNANTKYLPDGRPRCYKILQKWMEEKEKTRNSRGQRPRTISASLTEDSCFWAYVEEALKGLEDLNQGEHQSPQSLEQFEEYVTTVKKTLSISSDVYLEGSSFMTWSEGWEKYKKDHSSLMELSSM